MKRAGLLGLAALVLVLGILAWTVSGLRIPADPAGDSRTFQVEAGASLTEVAAQLEREGLLSSRPLFGPGVLVWFARLRGQERQIKSGEYDLSPAQTPMQILARLVAGHVKTYPVTVAPGLRSDEVARLLEEAEIVSEEAFLRAVSAGGFARELGLEAERLEGYLYPETYRFRRGTPAEEVARRMVDEFNASWTEQDRQRAFQSQLSIHEIVTLASIVEKEAGTAQERPIIAGVFHNRLARGMRLQSDPTVIYGLVASRGSWDGNIRSRDLRTDTPYNTYTRAGLPPGPIAGVTMDAIRAVLEPADVPFLYFVARNDGTHQFSRTLREHTNAVNRYQRSRSRRPGPS